MAKTSEKTKYARRLIFRNGLTLKQANAKVKGKFGAGLDAVSINSLKASQNKKGSKYTTVGVAKRKRTFAKRRIELGWTNDKIQTEARKRYGSMISDNVLSSIRKELGLGKPQHTPKKYVKKAAAKSKPSKPAKKKTKAKAKRKMTAPQAPKANGVSEAMHLILDGLHQLMKAEGVEALEINSKGDVRMDIRKVEVASVELKV